MENSEVVKSKAFLTTGILEYVPNTIVTKTIIRRTTGNVSAVACDSGAMLIEKISPFDTFIQVIEGKAEIVIDNTSCSLESGQSIIIPAHCRNSIRAKVRFKILSTTIKSGYEEVI